MPDQFNGLFTASPVHVSKQQAANIKAQVLREELPRHCLMDHPANHPRTCWRCCWRHDRGTARGNTARATRGVAG
ncbi:hypothetical protein QNM99_15035 [Pseudomonas sp. PCH446]